MQAPRLEGLKTCRCSRIMSAEVSSDFVLRSQTPLSSVPAESGAYLSFHPLLVLLKCPLRADG